VAKRMRRDGFVDAGLLHEVFNYQKDHHACKRRPRRFRNRMSSSPGFTPWCTRMLFLYKEMYLMALLPIGTSRS
jgi:hypothetical protein